jgi:hypothetical protein
MVCSILHFFAILKKIPILPFVIHEQWIFLFHVVLLSNQFPFLL